MRGRPPKPTALKLARGNPGRHPLNLREPAPEVGMPEAPSWLPEEAVEHWQRLGRRAVSMKVMTEADGDALAWMSYLTAEAIREAKESGKAPLALIKELRSHRAEFGMSPSARVRVKVADDAKKESTVQRFLRAV